MLNSRSYFKSVVFLALGGVCNAASADDYGTAGFGWGIPYATLGLNVDIKVTRDFYLTESVGSGFSDTGYALGGRYYVRRMSENMRLRTSAIYGVYGGVKYNTTDQLGNPVNKKGEDFATLALGVGIEWMSGDEGFDFDVLYVDTASVRSRERELHDAGYRVYRVGADNISVGVGYRHRID